MKPLDADLDPGRPRRNGQSGAVQITHRTNGTYEGTWRFFTLSVCTEVPRQGNLIDPTPFSPLLSVFFPFTAKKSARRASLRFADYKHHRVKGGPLLLPG